MPTKNVVKIFTPDAYYHVYNRGWNLGKIFIDETDYVYFEKLLERYLSNTPDDSGKQHYRQFYSDVHLNAYCLMGNHFHMLLYQYKETAITQLMRSLINAYTAYFNARHKRRGSLFESRFKAVWVNDDTQLMHITRYIHLNHTRYKEWKYSSYMDYITVSRSWIDPSPILDLFSSIAVYESFVSGYEKTQRERDSIKAGLYGRKI